MHVCMCACMCACREYMIYYIMYIPCIIYQWTVDLYRNICCTMIRNVLYLYTCTKIYTHIIYIYIYIIYIQIHGAWMAPRCWYQPGPCKNACKTGVIKMPQLRGKLSEVEAETLPHEVMDIPWGSIPWSPYHPWDWYIYHIYRWLTDFCGKCR